MKSYPAWIEVRGEDGSEVFHSLDAVLASVHLQAGVVDKRQWKRIVSDLKARGRLNEIPYIGPAPQPR
ncbi:MAG: hypothetical protein EOS65_10850 [Mesorhizobium sp.]|uniref:hypothetical protein n=1 Tax=Mesorhizobium sp. TaxID=1871066 RepID=UPI000FE7B369|nr:hypothetical protein [Mesorhizobium sp.]RWF41833.1 MAG: hypothetical protein EOS65_10850 [Mesorhizobium sp.]